MISLVQPNGASCLPTAFASILGVQVEEMFDFLGHDGMEVLWPELLPPLCYRSFHIQEMYEYALTQNFAVVTLAPVWGLAPDELHMKPYECERMQDYINYYVSVFTGITGFGNYHAVAWDGIQMMDPETGEFCTIDFTITHVHLVLKIA